MDRVKADRSALELRVSTLKNEQLYYILNRPIPRNKEKEAIAYGKLERLTEYTEELVSMATSYGQIAGDLHSAYIADVENSAPNTRVARNPTATDSFLEEFQDWKIDQPGIDRVLSRQISGSNIVNEKRSINHFLDRFQAWKM
jgi:hypothetical protein